MGDHAALEHFDFALGRRDKGVGHGRYAVVEGQQLSAKLTAYYKCLINSVPPFIFLKFICKALLLKNLF